MRRFLLWLISLYQQYLSPRKGFCCAYRHYTGNASCSTFGMRVIRRYGTLNGLHLLRHRLQRCAQISRACRPNRPRARHQAGFIDCNDVACCALEWRYLRRHADEEALYQKHYGRQGKQKTP